MKNTDRGNREPEAAGSGSIPIHETQVDVRSEIPTTVEVGTAVALDVAIACPFGCDLSGSSVLLTGPGGFVTTHELGAFDGQAHKVSVTILAPDDAGHYEWTMLFPKYESQKCIHQEVELPISFAAKPHTPSMAVWDVPSPVMIESAFRVKVGVTCPITCHLTGQLVEVRDEGGARVGEGRLGGAVWPGTTAMYWTDVEMSVPATEGVRLWTATFSAALSPLAHGEVSAGFSFRAAGRPQHLVSVKMIAKDSGLPLGDAEVRVGLYEAWTDEGGMASVRVPQGTYELSIRKDGYSAPETTVEVSRDLTVAVEASVVLTKAEREARMKRYEDVWGEADW